MLFLISWKISAANRVACWNVFGNMTPEDDLKDAGPNIKIVGHVGKDDCRHFLDFMPNKKIIEKENFTLYNNYHK